MRDQTLLALGIGGTLGAIAGVFMIIFRARGVPPNPNATWKDLLRRSHTPTPRDLLVVGCGWVVIGSLLAIAGFVNLL